MKFLEPKQLESKTREWSEKLELNCSETVLLKRPALLILDMQNEFLTDAGQLPVWGGPAVIEQINRMASAFRQLRWQVFYTRHLCIEPYRHIDELGSMKNVCKPQMFLQDGTYGADFHEGVSCLPSDLVITKYRYSGFFDTPLDTLLKVNQITQVVITGVATNICCETTAHDAFFRGYDVLFTLDATGGTDEAAHLAALRNILLSYGQVVTAHQILEATRAQATHQQFNHLEGKQ